MSGKQHKREIKRQRELARQEARRQERRRSLITVAIIGVVVLLGGLLAWVTIAEERAVELAAACDATRPAAAGDPKPTFENAPDFPLDDGDFTAVVETSCGTVVIDLYEDRAPETVRNFVALSAIGFYDGLEIFRNAPSIFALQTGAATNDGTFQIGYTFADELEAAEDEGYSAGSLAMANSGPDTNGSQFFFTYGDSELAPNYTKFGQATEGLEVLERIGAIPVDGERPQETIYIERVRILLDGEPWEPPAQP